MASFRSASEADRERAISSNAAEAGKESMLYSQRWSWECEARTRDPRHESGVHPSLSLHGQDVRDTC